MKILKEFLSIVLTALLCALLILVLNKQYQIEFEQAYKNGGNDALKSYNEALIKDFSIKGKLMILIDGQQIKLIPETNEQENTNTD